MRIKNMNGTSQNTCFCGSWLNHWKNFSGQSVPDYCPINNCFEKAEVGGHVQKDTPSDNSWYILPICKVHNAKRDDSFTAIDTYKLVSANVKVTCQK